jgi:transcriptional regulator with XRE-family HTH domain
MNATYKLVEIVKAKKEIDSDYGIAMLLGVSKGMVSHWKLGRSEANGVNLLKLIKEANLSIDDALKIMSDVEYNEKQLKQAGFSNVAFLSTLSAGGFGAMSLLNMTHLPYEAIGTWLLSSGSFYIM